MRSSARVILSDIDKNRSDWLKLRERKVSSSNIAAIAGLSRFTSPMEVFAEWQGKKKSFEGNDATRLGQLLEPFAAELYSRRTGRKVRRVNALIGNKKYPWAVVSPDYYETLSDGSEGVLEIKTGNHHQRQFWQNGACPQEYIAQHQFQLGITEKKLGTISAFLGLDDQEDYSRPYKFDKELFGLLVEKSEEFLDHIKRDIPPEAGPGDAAVIRTLMEKREGRWKIVGADGKKADKLVSEIQKLAEAMSPLRREFQELRIRKLTAENKLRMILKGARTGILPSGREVRHSVTQVVESKPRRYTRDVLTVADAKPKKIIF